MALINVQEETYTASHNRVDEDKGIVYDCLILGAKSHNGRLYPHDIRQKHLAEFEGKRCYVDHHKATSPHAPKNKPPDKCFAKAFNCRNVQEGIRADIKVIKRHPFSAIFLDACANMPEAFGFSPDIWISTTTNSEGVTVVDDIGKVDSIDVVADPATTRNVFEEEEAKEVASEVAKEEEAPAEEEHLDPKSAQELALMHQILAEVEAYLDKGGDHAEHHKRIGQHLAHHTKMYHGGKDDEEAPADKKEEAPAKEEDKKPEHKQESLAKLLFNEDETYQQAYESAPAARKYPVKAAKSSSPAVQDRSVKSLSKLLRTSDEE